MSFKSGIVGFIRAVIMYFVVFLAFGRHILGFVEQQGYSPSSTLIVFIVLWAGTAFALEAILSLLFFMERELR